MIVAGNIGSVHLRRVRPLSASVEDRPPTRLLGGRVQRTDQAQPTNRNARAAAEPSARA